VVEALQYWADLGKAGIHLPGVVEWGTTPKDFFEKKAAIIYTTTGNLTNIKANAKFDFGVGMIPGKRKARRPAAATSTSSRSRRRRSRSAFKFAKWVTRPNAPRSGAWTPATLPSRPQPMKPTLFESGRDFPAALVARDQLPVSVASSPRTTTSA
jgi:sn-glycerol 3-phosphate transport system substrate-binding protein